MSPVLQKPSYNPDLVSIVSAYLLCLSCPPHPCFFLHCCLVVRGGRERERDMQNTKTSINLLIVIKSTVFDLFLCLLITCLFCTMKEDYYCTYFIFISQSVITSVHTHKCTFVSLLWRYDACQQSNR